jgi:phosphate transport system substrate-binding protein
LLVGIIIIFSLIGLAWIGANVYLIKEGGKINAYIAAGINVIPIGLSFLVFLVFSNRAWYFYVTWIVADLLVIGFISGLVLRFWNIKKFIVWLACFALAVGGICASYAYDQYLHDITLREYFKYETYTPFTANTLAKTLDEEPTLRFTDVNAVPRMDGATALYPVYAAFAQATYPSSMADMKALEIIEKVGCSTTGYAYRNIVDGRCDIIFVAGPSEEQEAYAAEKGVELVYTPIGREAFVFFVHPNNPLDSMTLSQIRSIYSGETTKWDQLGVKGLGNIRAYQREEGSGSQTALKRFVMRDTPLMNAETEMVQGGMGDMVEQVSSYKNHRNAIGYSFRFYCTALMKGFDVKLLAINGVEPTVENIENGTYPLASSFYAVTCSDADENTLALLDWICGPQGQELVEKSGYTPINTVD